MRMVYRICGVTIPKRVRDILQRKGADFSDYFPVTSNQNLPHKTHQGAIGFFEENRDLNETALEVRRLTELYKMCKGEERAAKYTIR